MAQVFLNASGSNYPSTSASKLASDAGFVFLSAPFSHRPSPQKQLQGSLPEELRENSWLEERPEALIFKMHLQSLNNSVTFTYIKIARGT